MKTVVIRIGNVMPTQKRGEHFTQTTQTNSGAILPGHGAKGTLGEGYGHEEWKQKTEADISVRESLELLIRSAGWDPRLFAAAQEFLSLPRILGPSCLVLDVSLPGLNGLDLQKRVAGERPDMPIIFITGYGDVPMSVRAMKAGAAEFLTKPFSDDVLLSAIRQAIERSCSALRREAEIGIPRDSYMTLTLR